MNRKVLLIVHLATALWLTRALILGQAVSFADEPAKAPPNDSATSSTVSTSTSSTPVAASPDLGLLAEQRQKLSDLLQEAEKLGIGISQYRAEFMQIEEAAKGVDLPAERLSTRIESLTRSLKEQMDHYKISHQATSSAPARSSSAENGWILTQAKSINLGGWPAKYQWVGHYIYCTKNALRDDNSLENGFFEISKAPDWAVYSCCSKNRTYTRGLATLAGPYPKSETELTGDMRKEYVRIQVKGSSPKIAGMKTKHYQQIYNAPEGVSDVSSEWLTADPQFLPVELRRVTKGTELHLREYVFVGGSISALYDSAKRVYTLKEHIIGHKQLSLDTLSWKAAAIPSTVFDLPVGYRYLPPLEFATELMPGWIRELDRGNPKDKRILSH